MPTIRDVARECDVSIATVSRVFNDSPLVSETTRQRVVAAASRIGYWPNGIARSLITSRTHALGVLLPDLHGEFFSELLHGIDLAARVRGYHLLVSRFGARREELVGALRTMRGRVEGVIVMAPDLEPLPWMQQGSGDVPAVLVNPDPGLTGVRGISIANAEGAATMVRHLLSLGHRRIATVAGPAHNVDARQRLEGWRAALAASSITPDESSSYSGDFGEASGYEAMRSLMANHPRPDAVFFANDNMAIGALGALQERGVRVPEEVAIAGFDDIPMARYVTPPLTTVRVDKMRLGRRAVEMVLEAMAGAPIEGDGHALLATALVVRRSCGAAADSVAGAWVGDPVSTQRER
jgi:LacI family transcriptional regulator